MINLNWPHRSRGVCCVVAIIVPSVTLKTARNAFSVVIVGVMVVLSCAQLLSILTIILGTKSVYVSYDLLYYFVTTIYI